eukprot:3483993-Pleurochrysis_carterae.AAC.1
MSRATMRTRVRMAMRAEAIAGESDDKPADDGAECSTQPKTSKLSKSQRLARQVGLQAGCISVPSTIEFSGNKSKGQALKCCGDRVKRHVASVVGGRCDDADGARLVHLPRRCVRAWATRASTFFARRPSSWPFDKGVDHATLDRVHEHCTARFSYSARIGLPGA